MKDYSQTKEEKRDFVLRYEIDDENSLIVVYFADGKISRVPYSKENEERLIRKLEEQLENSVKCLKKLKTKVIPKQEITITTICGAATIVPIIMNNPTISYVVPGAAALAVTGLCIAEGKARSKISDIEKNKLFMENKSLFTKGKLNDNVISALRLKNTGIFASKERIELNDVDRVSLKEMKKLVANLKREETMGFDYDVPKIHAKKFTL